MDRITEKRGGQNVIPLRQDGKLNWALYSAGIRDAHTEFLYGVHADKLAEYEDLEEQCIKETTWSLRMLLKKWKEFFEDIRELYEYRKLEEQGLLLKLPCAVGQNVYEVYRFLDEGALEIDVHKIRLEDLEKLGETVFLTRAEAEEALREMSGMEG